MGHRDEARAALLAYFNAQPTGKMREETAGTDTRSRWCATFATAQKNHLSPWREYQYRVRRLGLVLWVLGEYIRKYDDSALLETRRLSRQVYASARDYVVKPLLANLEKSGNGLIMAADTSISKERRRDRSTSHLDCRCHRGPADFAEIAHRARDDATRTGVLNSVALLEKGFDAAFVRMRSFAARWRKASKTTPTEHCWRSSISALPLIPRLYATRWSGWNFSR